MNKKRFITSGIAAFVIVSVLEYVFHNICLKDTYAATAGLWRPMAEMTPLMPFGMLINLVTVFLFVYIYAVGYQGKPSPLGEGLRCGLVIGLFASLPMAGWSYITIPMPFTLAVHWFLMGMVEFLVVGAAVGLIYKK